MSAGAKGAYPGEPPLEVHHDLDLLAPQMKAAVAAAMAECRANGLPVVVAESYRTLATAQAYYRRGRSQRPPLRTVTNAPDNTFSWHGYGLAVDIIHETKAWDVPVSWFAAVAEIFLRHGMKWGGHWTQKDYPHFQWGKCKAGPSDRARELLRTGGTKSVWVEVGAD